MSGPRLTGSRVRGALVAAVTAALLLAGCSDDQQLRFNPGPSDVKIDTAQLARQKAAAGVEDCRPGPGGGSLPAVTVQCLGGGTPVDLSTLRGPLVLNFWASNCGPCREEMPILQKFHEKYAQQVQVIGVDFIDTYPGTALQQVKKRGVTYPLLADPGGDLAQQPALARLTRSGLPTLGLVDGDGKVAYVSIGAVGSLDELVALVEDHLGVQL